MMRKNREKREIEYEKMFSYYTFDKENSNE